MIEAEEGRQTDASASRATGFNGAASTYSFNGVVSVIEAEAENVLPVLT